MKKINFTLGDEEFTEKDLEDWLRGDFHRIKPSKGQEYDVIAFLSQMLLFE